jgi:hypothetical protein
VLTDFNLWLSELPHRHKVVIPGNHDLLLTQDIGREQITNAHLLISSGVEIEGLSIWGSPITPYGNVAFGISGRSERAEHWSSIHERLDILVTHEPPHRVLDCGQMEIHRHPQIVVLLGQLLDETIFDLILDPAVVAAIWPKLSRNKNDVKFNVRKSELGVCEILIPNHRWTDVSNSLGQVVFEC